MLKLIHWKVCPLGMQSTSDGLQTLRPLSGQVVSCTNSTGFPVTVLSPTTLLSFYQPHRRQEEPTARSFALVF